MELATVHELSELFQALNVGDKIRYNSLGGPQTGIVKDMLDHVLMVQVGESMLLMKRGDIQLIPQKSH